MSELGDRGSSNPQEPQQPQPYERRLSRLEARRSALRLVGALGVVALALVVADKLYKKPASTESGKPIPAAPACPAPSQAETRTIDKMFTPIRRPKYINTGLVAKENGLISYDWETGDQYLEFMPHDSVAGIRRVIEYANKYDLKPYGLSVHAGTRAYAKDGWKVPSATELMGDNTVQEIEDITYELGDLPTDYVKLTGVHTIALMTNPGNVQAEVGGEHTILLNVAHDPDYIEYDLDSFPINEQLYRYIDWKEGCDVRDPAFAALNGRSIYAPHHHRGLVSQDSYAEILVSNWEYERDLAAKKGNRQTYCRLDNLISKEQEKMVVMEDEDFGWIDQDKADIAGTAFTSEELLGYALDPSTPVIRNKVLLELARLRKLKLGSRPVGKQIVNYFAGIADYPKSENEA